MLNFLKKKSLKFSRTCTKHNYNKNSYTIETGNLFPVSLILFLIEIHGPISVETDDNMW